jgi:hypothetical protein
VTVPTGILYAFDATNLANQFYNSAAAPNKRDAMGKPVHFEMPVVADGHVYVNGQTQLTVYGLLQNLQPDGGNNQTGQAGTQLPVPLQVQLQDPYNGPIQQAGINVTFTSSGKGGQFYPATVTTNASGVASTTYELPNVAGTYTITASSTGYAPGTFTVTGTAGTPSIVSVVSGGSQKEPVNSQLDAPLVVKVKDSTGNGLSGVSVTFSDGGAGGTFNPPSATTGASGTASTSYMTGTKAGAVSISGTVTGLTPAIFKETVVAGPAAALTISGGNNQTVKPGAAAPKALTILVADQYGNPVSNAAVNFTDGGAGGTFSVNPAISNPKGIALTKYTAPESAGPVTVTGSFSGLTSVQFTLTVE